MLFYSVFCIVQLEWIAHGQVNYSAGGECKVQDIREERKVLLVFLLLASRLTLSAMTDRQY